MKKIFNVISLIAVAAIIISGCKQKDTTAPKIFLEGDNPLVHVLNETFTDPGYTAEDNKDGDITSSVSADMTDLDEDKRGEYTITYTVSDAEGNSTQTTRTVNVKNSIEPYCIAYSVSKIYDGDPDTTYSTTLKPSNTINNTIKFPNMGAYNLNISGDIETEDVDSFDNTITRRIDIPSQDIYREADGLWYRIIGRKTTESIPLSQIIINGSDVTIELYYSLSTDDNEEFLTPSPAVNIEETLDKQ